MNAQKTGKRQWSLLTKLSLGYIGISAIVLVLGGLYVFQSIRIELDDEEARRFRSLMKDAVSLLETGIPPDSIPIHPMQIFVLDFDQEIIPFSMTDTMVWHSRGQKTERQLVATASYKINGKHYLLQSQVFGVETEDITSGVFHSVWIMLLFLLMFVLIAGRLIFKRILSPFRYALQGIRAFRIKQQQPIPVVPTTTKEFGELNDFLQLMSRKAVGDYQILKESTENTSHELQTPLAVMRSKLELLMGSDLTDEQAALVLPVYNAVEHLSKINRSLVLLAKLENKEYESTEPVDFSKICCQSIEAMQEMIAMKEITLTQHIQEKVIFNTNPVLAGILISNLLGNAIQHNVIGGSIDINLTRRRLMICNTGNQPGIPVEELFKRFRKADPSTSSPGLGLPIARQICTTNHWHISYRYDAKQLHIVEVDFA